MSTWILSMDLAFCLAYMYSCVLILRHVHACRRQWLTSNTHAGLTYVDTGQTDKDSGGNPVSDSSWFVPRTRVLGCLSGR